MADYDLKIDQIIVNKYLTDYNVKTFTALNLSTAKKLFIQVIADFRKGTISMDVLGYIGSQLFHAVGKKHHEDKLFFNATISALDLVFSARYSYDTLPILMDDIDRFYEAYSTPIKK